MKKIILSLALMAASSLVLSAQTDCYIKLYDAHKAHPRISSITYPGDADNLDMYNSIYGHGVVIENPWVAYRVYMDNRQSLDLYVKQTPRLELDITGFYTTPGQLAEGYGCDVLWAGKSVAAGSFRGYINGTPVTIDTVASRTQTVLSPSAAQVIDKEWLYNGKPIDMVQTYTMSGDEPALNVEIQLSGHAPDDIFCTGIQKLEKDPTGFIDPTGIAASWGSNIPDKNHPELVETVGLGIIVDPVNIISVKEDDVNYLVLLKPDSEGKIRYRVYATATRLKDSPADANEWFNTFKKIALK